MINLDQQMGIRFEEWAEIPLDDEEDNNQEDLKTSFLNSEEWVEVI